MQYARFSRTGRWEDREARSALGTTRGGSQSLPEKILAALANAGKGGSR